MRYTFSDEEDDDDTSDVGPTRRSRRQTSLPAPTEPTVTASGRQVRSKYAGHYGDSIQVEQRKSSNGVAKGDASTSNGRPQRSTRQNQSGGGDIASAQRGRGLNEYDSDEEMEDEPDTPESGHPWEKSDNEDDANDFEGDDEDEEEDDVDEMDQSDDGVNDGSSETRDSLVVRLPYRKGSATQPKENGIVKAEGAPPPHHNYKTDENQQKNGNGLSSVPGKAMPNGVNPTQPLTSSSASNMPFSSKPTAPFDTAKPATTKLPAAEPAMQM